MKRREFLVVLGGGATAWPLAATAQQVERIRRIAILTGSATDDPNNRAWIAAFKSGLERLGWKEGLNIQIELRGARGDTTLAQQQARELLALNPEVIFTTSTPTAVELTRDNRTIPIVFTNVSDPLGSGLVPSLASPGGIVTGFTNFEFGIGGKWLEILKDISPNIVRASLIFSPSAAPYSGGYVRSFEAAARAFGVGLTIAPVANVTDVQNAVGAQAREPGGSAIILPDIFTVANRQEIIGAAMHHRLPMVYPYRVMVADGGLVAYGPDIPDLYRRAATYIDRIIKGEKPADLPVQQPIKYELAINLRTAKALGLTFPQRLLATADEVIE